VAAESSDVMEALPGEEVVVVDADQVEVPISARLAELEEKVHKDAGVSSLFFTILLGSAMISGVYALNWILNIERLRKTTPTMAVEMVDEPPGEEEGKKGFASDLEEVPDEMPNPQDIPPDVPPELAKDLLEMIQQTDFDLQPKKAAAEGAGFGSKGSGFGKGGSSRSQRWVIEWGSEPPTGYKKKLDHFKIYIGAVRGGNLVGAMRGFDEGAAKDSTGKPPDLWFVHQDKSRVEIDRDLLRKGGVAVGPTDVIAQFYPPELQAQMVAVETKHQNKKESEIKKTVFGIRGSAGGYELYVIEQTLN
jgi:hypothetical protein